MLTKLILAFRHCDMFSLLKKCGLYKCILSVIGKPVSGQLGTKEFQCIVMCSMKESVGGSSL